MSVPASRLVSASLRSGRPAGSLCTALAAFATPLAGSLCTAFAALATPLAGSAAQDTTSAIPLPGVRVVVPRPSATTGGASAITVSLDSAGVVAAPTAEELLRRIPVLQLRTNSRGEVQPNLRGAEDRQIAVLVDGIPLTLGWDHRTDLSIVPLTAVRRMTLLRELSSVLHGPNVLGGAIELDVVRGPAGLLAAPALVGAISVDQEGGVSAGATSGAKLERDFSFWLLRAGAGFRKRPGVALPRAALSDRNLSAGLLADSDGRRLNSDRQQVDGFVAARYQGIGGAWVSSLVSAFEADRGVPPEAHVDDPRLWRYPSQSRLFATVSGGTGERDTSLGEAEVEANLGFDYSSMRISEYETPAYRSVSGGETGTTTTLTGRFGGEHVFGNGMVELGLAATFARVGQREAPHEGPHLDYLQHLWSVGGELRVGGGPSGSSMQWTAGVALDGARTPKSGDKPRLGALSAWAFRTGFTRTSAGGRVLYHASVSRRDRFPSLRELYSGALGRFVPNPFLRPERLVAGEAGATVSLGSGEFQLTAFNHRFAGGIGRSTLPTPMGTKFVRVNHEDVRSIGIELVIAGRAGAFSYGGDLTLQRVRVWDSSTADGHHRAEYEPAVSGMVNVGVVGPWRMALNSIFRFRGPQYCQSVQTAGLEALSSSATVDVEARRVFTTGAGRVLDGTIALANAGDSMVLDQCGLPQPGRTVRIQFGFR